MASDPSEGLPLELLACPECRAPLEPKGEGLRCSRCLKEYPLKDGIPDFL